MRTTQTLRGLCSNLECLDPVLPREAEAFIFSAARRKASLTSFDSREHSTPKEKKPLTIV